MTQKTRVLTVRVVGFSAPEKQMLNSIFLLSVAPARQIGYKLWNSESGAAPDMYLLDGDSESAVASWQAAFSNTSERTLVVGSKNTDLGVASAARPLGLKVVGAMDRLAIALNNVERSSLARETAGLDVSEPRAGGTLPSASLTHNSSVQPSPPPAPAPVAAPAMSAQPQPFSASLNANLNSLAPMSAAATTLSGSSNAMRANPAAPATHSGTLPTAMTAAAPAATVLPSMTLQPNVAPFAERNEKPVTEKAVDKILSEKPLDKPFADKVLADRLAAEKAVADKLVVEKMAVSATLGASSGVTPLSPSALSAAVAPSTSRVNLRVVPTVSPLAASLPAATSAHARIAEAPMVAPMAPAPSATATHARLPEAPVLQAPPPPAAPAAPPAVTPVAPVGHVPAPRHEEQVFRVLAVDDSPLMRTFLQNKLAPYGIVPEFAASGEEALFKISKLHFDMIFLDVMLPGMDGYDVCKMIKKNKDNALMKVVMLTSKDKTFDKIRGTMAGCDGYLTKPVDELKLRAIIERHTVTRK